MAHLGWQVGGVRVTRIEERIHGVARDALVPGITDADLEAHREWAGRYFSSSGKMLVSVHTFVVEDEGHTIVVDTCSGAEPARPLPGDPEFLARLAAAIEGGVAAVDTVLCTHLHFDHVGWNTRVENGVRVPTFPNARYLFARAELDALRDDDHAGVLDPAIQPLLDAQRVDLVEMDHVITRHVRLMPTPGHTPGHVSVVIESDGSAGVITGDIMHTPLQVALPDRTASPFDSHPNRATETRKRFLDERADTGCLVMGTHFPPPTAGYVVGSVEARRFVPPHED